MEFVSQSQLEDSRIISNASVLARNAFTFPLESDSSASPSFEFAQNRSLERWAHLYNQKNQLQADQSKGVAAVSGNGAVNSEATSVTTKALPLPAPGGALFVGGATGKVGKKRSRASRRAPTTLLSTDTANFRAMVQQFTGIPESPYAPHPQGHSLGRSLYHFTPQHNYSSFLLQDRMNSAPLFLTRVPPSQGGNTASLDGFGPNPVFSGPVMLPHLGISDSLIK